MFKNRISFGSLEKLIQIAVNLFMENSLDEGSNPSSSTNCSVRLTVRTLGFHPKNRGSIPLRSAILLTKLKKMKIIYLLILVFCIGSCYIYPIKNKKTPCCPDCIKKDSCDGTFFQSEFE